MGDDSISNWWTDRRVPRWITVQPLSWPRSKWRDILGNNLRKTTLISVMLNWRAILEYNEIFSGRQQRQDVKFSEVSGITSIPISKVGWWFGSIKTDDSTSKDGEGVGSRNVGKNSHLDTSVYSRKFHWILSLRKLQDFIFWNISKLNNHGEGTQTLERSFWTVLN